jgi:hypothetical protein
MAFRAALIAVSVAGAANPSIAAKITECTKSPSVIASTVTLKM